MENHSYIIQDEITRTKYHIIYKAKNYESSKVLAIKAIDSKWYSSEEIRKATLAQARIAQRLVHTNILKIESIFEEGNAAYIVMEYLGGRSLRELMDAQPRGMETSQVLELVIQIISALEYAHTQGVFHRNLNPDSIIFDEEGSLKITGFGKTDNAWLKIEPEINIFHPVFYIAPEVFQGDLSQAQADQYSLGVLIYQMLSGKLPWSVDLKSSHLQLKQQTLSRPVLNPELFGIDIPDWLYSIVNKCLMIEPKLRFVSVTELKQALQDKVHIPYQAVTTKLTPPLQPSPKIEDIIVPEHLGEKDPVTLVEKLSSTVDEQLEIARSDETESVLSKFNDAEESIFEAGQELELEDEAIEDLPQNPVSAPIPEYLEQLSFDTLEDTDQIEAETGILEEPAAVQKDDTIQEELPESSFEEESKVCLPEERVDEPEKVVAPIEETHKEPITELKPAPEPENIPLKEEARVPFETKAEEEKPTRQAQITPEQSTKPSSQDFRYRQEAFRDKATIPPQPVDKFEVDFSDKTDSRESLSKMKKTFLIVFGLAMLVVLYTVIKELPNIRKSIFPKHQTTETEEPEEPDQPEIEKSDKLDNKLIDLVFVKGDTLVIGSMSSEADPDEFPLKEIILKDFYIGISEVTQRQWKMVFETNPSLFKNDDNPVENISFYEAIEFCNLKSELDGLIPCYEYRDNELFCDFTATGYRLPTEAEWEFAAKEGQRISSYLYSGSSNPQKVGWYSANSGASSQEVASKEPNTLGIHDLSGNIFEWVWNWYSPYSYRIRDPYTGPETGSDKVIRGGSWYHDAPEMRSTNRNYSKPFTKSNYIGFRVARTKI